MKHFLKGICGEASNKEKKGTFNISGYFSHSKGKKIMPKNIELGLVLKRSVRSKELIIFLNNLEHSVSYGDVLRIDTTWAAGILEANYGYSTVPTEKTFLLKRLPIKEITVKKTTLNMQPIPSCINILNSQGHMLIIKYHIYDLCLCL